MLVGEVILQRVVLLVGGFGLELEKMVLNGSKLVRYSGFTFSPLTKIVGKVAGFLGERS